MITWRGHLLGRNWFSRHFWQHWDRDGQLTKEQLNMDNKKLGQTLIQTGKLTKEQLKYAMSMHEKIGGDFSPLLVKLGYVSDEDLTGIIGKLEGIRTVDISHLVLPQKLLESLPRDVIEKHNVIPLAKKEGEITLAMADVNNYEAIEEIQFLTGNKVNPVLASREGIRKIIIQFYQEEAGESKKEEVEKKLSPIEEIENLVEESVIEAFGLQKALIALLIEKNSISKDELINKAKELSKKREKL
jgi:type IV pilus assembly protein PilB